MSEVKAHYNGHVFVPETPVTAKMNQEAIIVFAEPQHSTNYTQEQLLNMARRITKRNYHEMEKTLEYIKRAYLNE